MFRYNFARHKKHTINFRFLQYIFKFSVCNYKKIIKFYNCFPNICYIVFNRFCTIHRIEYQKKKKKYDEELEKQEEEARLAAEKTAREKILKKS